MNDLQRKLFKTRLVLIALAIVVTCVALGLHKLIR